MKYFYLFAPFLVGTVLVASGNPGEAKDLPSTANFNNNQLIELAANNATESYNSGVDKYQKGDLPGALLDFDEAIRLKDDFVEAYVNRANIKDDLGDPSGALVDYATALRYEKSDANIYYNRGLTYSRLKQYDKAVNDYDRAIEINPDYAPSYAGRAIIKHDILGDKEGGLKDLKTAADLYQAQGNEAKNRELMDIYRKLRP